MTATVPTFLCIFLLHHLQTKDQQQLSCLAYWGGVVTTEGMILLMFTLILNVQAIKKFIFKMG